MLTLEEWPPEVRPFVERVATWILGSLSGTDIESIDTLAADIYAYHCEHDDVARALRTGRRIHTVQDIPSIPVQLFKDVTVGTVSKDAAGSTFLTSGTTQGKRGAHHLSHSSLYELSALRWANACLPRRPKRGVHLLLDPTIHPESSLSHMMAHMTPTDASWHLPKGVVDVHGFFETLKASTDPVFIGATAFALAEILDAELVTRLPEGSMIMVTGGFKGRWKEVSDDLLYQKTTRLFPQADIVTEYGMTELSSQLWGQPGQPFRPPPWMKVWTCDPIKGTILPPDSIGQLCFFDLANVESALVIETMDRGQVDSNGNVHLLGRVADSQIRGCSLSVEEAQRESSAS